MISSDPSIEAGYTIAKERFAERGVDTDAVLKALDAIPISIQCWQGDDVLGFENPNGKLTGGIQTTGNYIGRARNAQDLRDDLELAASFIPGKKRVNLHAIYLEAGEHVERDQIEPHHFQHWIDWAKEHGFGLDFNPTCFSHPKSAHNLTLSHPDPGIRKYWIDHCIASRKISEHMGRELNNTVVMNIWVPDGFKDSPADRLSPRQRLLNSLDEILFALDGSHHKVAVEGKLFGIGAESYTVGSNEFYMAYASTRKTMLCIDMGHFHPTENVADKISTTLCFLDEILLHVSRPVRWDSDHVVLFDDATIAVANEIVRCNALNRVHIGLDFFDASINRVAAWVIGARNLRKALLFALLESTAALIAAERNFDFTRRLALMEEGKSMPWSSVWDYYCAAQNIQYDSEWLVTIAAHEKNVLSRRR
ncbi:MAG TPA: L-rhamnose isomerase [Terracidiphilus sp.]|nr:L-rhamnose isomerase [Terracidiphilus sp.]